MTENLFFFCQTACRLHPKKIFRNLITAHDIQKSPVKTGPFHLQEKNG